MINFSILGSDGVDYLGVEGGYHLPPNLRKKSDKKCFRNIRKQIFCRKVAIQRKNFL